MRNASGSRIGWALRVLGGSWVYWLAACGASSLPTDLSGSPMNPSFAGSGVRVAGHAGRGAAGFGAAGSGGPSQRGRAGAGGAAANGGKIPTRDAGATDGTPHDSGTDAGLDAAMPSTCGDGTYPGSARIVTQSDVVPLQGCKRIAGDLTIIARDLVDLHGLEALQTIDGSFQVIDDLSDGPSVSALSDPGTPSTATLTSLAGLDNLQRARTVVLDHLALTTLAPLAHLETTENLRITRLDSLQDLHGLERLRTPNVGIWTNANLRSLDGLSLAPASDTVLIVQNPKLTQASSALKTLRSAKLLGFGYLPALVNLDGLGQLSQLDGFALLGCDLISDLSALPKGITVEMLALIQNQRLRGTSELSMRSGNGYMLISDNPLLESLPRVVDKGASLDSITLGQLPLLKSLAGLENLQQLGSLNIQKCDALRDLSGLGQLRSVRGLSITDCLHVTSLVGVDSLQSIDSLLTLSDLPGLTSLSGMPKLGTLATLSLSNVGVKDLTGLENLTQIDQIAVNRCLNLQNLHGVENVKRLQKLTLGDCGGVSSLSGIAVDQLEVLSIERNPLLKDLAGLEALRSVAELSVLENQSLATLSGLDHLTLVTKSLALERNPVLTRLRALALLKPSASLKSIQVSGNRRLPECEVSWLSTQLMSPLPSGMNGPAGNCPP